MTPSDLTRGPRLAIALMPTLLLTLTSARAEEKAFEAASIETAQHYLECGRTLHAQPQARSEAETERRLRQLASCTKNLFAPKMSERNRQRLTSTLLLLQGAGTPSLCSSLAGAAERFVGIPKLPAAPPSIDLCFRFQLVDGQEKLGLLSLIPGSPQPKLVRFIY